MKCLHDVWGVRRKKRGEGGENLYGNFSSFFFFVLKATQQHSIKQEALDESNN